MRLYAYLESAHAWSTALDISSPASSCEPAVAAVLPGPRWLGCGGNGLGAVELGREVAMSSGRWVENDLCALVFRLGLEMRARDEVEAERGEGAQARYCILY